MDRSASAVWRGSLKEGKGTISTQSGLEAAHGPVKATQPEAQTTLPLWSTFHVTTEYAG